MRDLMKWAKTALGESCSSHCTALGRTCNAAALARQNAVTEANMPDVITALKTGGAAAGFACTSYATASARAAPYFRYFNGVLGTCYANSGSFSSTLSTCDETQWNSERLCCCLDTSDTAATVCATSAADCDASTWWDVTNKLCVPNTGCPTGYLKDSAVPTCFLVTSMPTTAPSTAPTSAPVVASAKGTDVAVTVSVSIVVVVAVVIIIAFVLVIVVVIVLQKKKTAAAKDADLITGASAPPGTDPPAQMAEMVVIIPSAAAPAEEEAAAAPAEKEAAAAPAEEEAAAAPAEEEAAE